MRDPVRDVPAAAVDGGCPTVISEDRTLLSSVPAVADSVSGEVTYRTSRRPDEQRAPLRGLAQLVDVAAVPWSIANDGSALVRGQLGDVTRLVALRRDDTQ